MCRGGVGAGGVVSRTSIPDTAPLRDIRRRFLDGDSLWKNIILYIICSLLLASIPSISFEEESLSIEYKKVLVVVVLISEIIGISQNTTTHFSAILPLDIKQTLRKMVVKQNSQDHDSTVFSLRTVRRFSHQRK